MFQEAQKSPDKSVRKQSKPISPSKSPLKTPQGPSTMSQKNIQFEIGRVSTEENIKKVNISKNNTKNSIEFPSINDKEISEIEEKINKSPVLKQQKSLSSYEKIPKQRKKSKKEKIHKKKEISPNPSLIKIDDILSKQQDGLKVIKEELEERSALLSPRKEDSRFVDTTLKSTQTNNLQSNNSNSGQQMKINKISSYENIQAVKKPSIQKPPNMKFTDLPEQSKNPLSDFQSIPTGDSQIISHKGSKKFSRNSINFVESHIFTGKPSKFAEAERADPRKERRSSSSSQSKSSQEEKSQNASMDNLKVNHSKSIVFRDSTLKRQSKAVTDANLLKRLVKAEEVETQTYGLKVELNKLKKLLEENDSTIKELQDKLDKNNNLTRDLKKNVFLYKN